MAAKKLQKAIENTQIKITVLDGNQGEMVFDFADLPQEVQDKLGPFGLSHKLGDAAAGKAGTDAEESITKVFEGLKNGDWSVRAPAAPKVSTKTIASNLDALGDDEKAAALAVLEKLGIKLPGLTNVSSADEDGSDD